MERARRYRQVAQLHVDCIDQGFLSMLGVRFLSLMYQAIDEADGSVLLVEERDGQVIGFVSGARRMRDIYLQMLRRWPALAGALIPSLVSPQRVLRILETARYARDHSDAGQLPRDELLSIGVTPAWRRQGCAERLYRRLEECFCTQGVSAFKIVVGASLGPAHRFYRRMGAIPVGEIEVHRGALSTVYVQTLRACGPMR